VTKSPVRHKLYRVLLTLLPNHNLFRFRLFAWCTGNPGQNTQPQNPSSLFSIIRSPGPTPRSAQKANSGTRTRALPTHIKHATSNALLSCRNEMEGEGGEPHRGGGSAFGWQA